MSARPMPNLRSAAAVLIAGLLLVYGIIFHQLQQQVFEGYSDFVSLYTAGKILHRGSASQLYDLRLQYEIQHEVAPNVQNRTGALPFVRPPFEAWLFRPLAHFSYRTAFVLWDLFSCGCLVAVMLLLREEVPALRQFSPIFIFAAILSYFPVFMALLQGQDSILLLAIYAVAFRALRRNEQFTGGMVLGLGTFKFPLLLPFLIPFVVTRKRISVVLGFLLTSLLLFAGSIATVGLSTAKYYPKYLLSIGRLAPGVNIPKDMPNIRGLLSVLLQSAASSKIGILILLLLSILPIAFVIRKRPLNELGSASSVGLWFSLNLVVTLLVSYHCHSFDLCLLVLPAGSVFGALLSEELSPGIRKALISMLILVLFSPLYLLVCFGLNYSSLLGLLLVAFAVAIGFAVTDVQRRPIQGAAAGQ
jgi:Glycosyltransferase family 87